MENAGYEHQTTTTTTTMIHEQVPFGDWQYGLFGCFGDFSVCCLAYWCPCWVVGEIAEHFGESKMSVCLWHGFGGCNFVPTLRNMLRKERNITGDLVNDHICGTLCFYCAIIQMRREIKTPNTTFTNIHVMERK